MNINNFRTEESCINYYIGKKYPQGVKCSHCGSLKIYQRSNPRVFDCNDCGNTFSPLKGTIFEKSTTDMRKWFYAIYLFLSNKNGISALQLKSEINVTYKTAWRMLQQIRMDIDTNDEKIFS
jgi:transposase-like protein